MSVAEYFGSVGPSPIFTTATVHVPRELQPQARTRTEAMHGVIPMWVEVRTLQPLIPCVVGRG